MKKNSIKVQILLSLIIQLVNYLVPLVVSPYISRVLLDTGIGNYSYAFSITSYFTLIITFGFDGYGNREVANHRSDMGQVSKIVTQIVGSKTILFFLATCVYLSLILNGVLTNGVNLSIYLALLLVLLGSAIDISFLFYGLEKVSVISCTTFAVNLVYMLSIFSLVKNANDLVFYTILKSCVHLFIYLILWIFVCTRIKDIKLSGRINFIKTLKAAFPYFLPGLIAVFANMVDQTMLGNLASNIEVGYYQQAYKLISLALAMISCVNPIILSRISYLQSSSNVKEIEDKVLKSFQLIMFLGLPSIFGLFSISRFFVPAFYGELFRPAVNVMYFLIPTIVFSPLVSLWMNSFFYPLGKANQASMAMAIGNVCNIIINFVLIAKMRACGAALGTSLANIIILVISLWLTREYYNGLLYIKSFLKTFVASIAMFILIMLGQMIVSSNIHNDILLTLFSLCIGVFTYGIVCIVVKEEFMAYMLTILGRIIKRGEKNIR